MRKLWTIARKDVIAVFTDRNLILLMLVTPLAVSTIIALAFGNFTGDSAPLQDIPVALVNLDQGDANGFNAGTIFVSAFAADAQTNSDENSSNLGSCDAVTVSDGNTSMSLEDLTQTTLLDDPTAARAGVDAGEYAAAIIIPANYSSSAAYTQGDREINPVSVEVYGDSARTVSAEIIRGITEGIANQVLTGQITIAATIDTLITRAQENPGFGLTFLAANSSGDFQPNFACAFTRGFSTVQIEQQTISGSDTQNTNPLVLFGSAQAVFFALFTATGGATDIMDERRNWTLQRMIVSPTPRAVILGGKALGVLVMVLLQLLFLFVALSVISGLLYGIFAIWGTNLPAIALMLVFTALAAAGVGILIAAIAKTTEQASIVGSIVAMFMGVLGGAFFPIDAIPVLQPFTRLSVVRWGSEGFNKLSQGNSDILVNLVFLALIGTALFLSGFVIFNRRQDI